MSLLTPEEQNRIYEEERVRVEARIVSMIIDGIVISSREFRRFYHRIVR